MVYLVVACIVVSVFTSGCGGIRMGDFTTPPYTTHNLANCVEYGHQKSIIVKELMGLWNVIEVIEHSERYTDKRNYLRYVSRSESCPVVHFATDNDRVVRLLWKDEGGYIQYNFLMGLWNVIEVIEHSERYTDKRNYLRYVSRSESCPVVHFATDNDRVVRLLWNDEGGYIQYNFRMPNINNPGFWMSVGYQTGTMVDNHYEHFSGNVQVMKAVQSHLVLTFCAPHERHFSIILSRSKYLSHDEIRGVHKQLNRVNLPLVAIQDYCSNAGLVTNPSVLLAIVLAMTVYYANKHLST